MAPPSNYVAVHLFLFYIKYMNVKVIKLILNIFFVTEIKMIC